MLVKVETGRRGGEYLRLTTAKMPGWGERAGGKVIPNSHPFQRPPTDERSRRHSGLVRGVQRGHSDAAQRRGQVHLTDFHTCLIQGLIALRGGAAGGAGPHR